MKKNEIYTYTREELNKNRIIMIEKNINDIKYITENTTGNIYLPNSNIDVGKISFINNLVIDNNIPSNTVFGTLITNHGTIIFNYFYLLKLNNSVPPSYNSITTKPTFVSGKYINYKDITITRQLFDSDSERIIVIEYYE